MGEITVSLRDVAAAPPPTPVEWRCPTCPGTVMATVVGRKVLLPGGAEFWGVARAIVVCPTCGRRRARWLVRRR